LSIVHVVVVGCGRVGSGLAQAVEAAGHTAAIIDRREKAFSRLPDSFSGKRVLGVGFDRDRLTDAGIDEASAVAAVTNGDNSNIMIARVAKETYGIERVVARIYDPRRAAIYERLGIPTGATVQWATERVLRRVLPDQSAIEWIDPSARVALVERAVPTDWAGRKVGELDVEGLARVMAVSRLGVAQVPTLDLVVQDGDVIYAAIAGDRIGEFETHLSGGTNGGGNH
jgi:trk system potassium uptake protein TrkA